MTGALATTPARRRRASPYRLVAPVVREHPLQRQIARTLTLELCRAGHVSRDGVVWFCIDAADYGGDVPGTRIGRGIVAGIPDLLVLWQGVAYWLEIKADDGVLSDDQRAIGAALIKGRCGFGVVRNADEVLALLDAWAIPRNRRTHLDGRRA